VNDFILPPTENAAVSITTRIKEFEYVLKECKDSDFGNTSSNYSCDVEQRCIAHPNHRDVYGNVTSDSKRQLCWIKSPPEPDKENYQALDYILFVKNFVQFPLFNLTRDNFPSNSTTPNYTDKCEYDSKLHPLCPKFRVSKILEMVEQNSSHYQSMFRNGSLIAIKINWKCNLDRGKKPCELKYEFKRLDKMSHENSPDDSGSNFITAKHFFSPNVSELHRIHTHIYNLRIIISVTGEVGKFDLLQATTSIGSFVGIITAGKLGCDLIITFFTNFKKVKYAC
jgi:hypothetical protein